MTEPKRPVTVPKGVRWGYVTLSTGTRVLAYFSARTGKVVVKSPVMRSRSQSWSPGCIANGFIIGAEDQCRRLYEAKGTGYVELSEPPDSYVPLTEPYDGTESLTDIADRVLSETPYRRRGPRGGWVSGNNMWCERCRSHHRAVADCEPMPAITPHDRTRARLLVRAYRLRAEKHDRFLSVDMAEIKRSCKLRVQSLATADRIVAKYLEKS